MDKRPSVPSNKITAAAGGPVAAPQRDAPALSDLARSALDAAARIIGRAHNTIAICANEPRVIELEPTDDVDASLVVRAGEPLPSDREVLRHAQELASAWVASFPPDARRELDLATADDALHMRVYLTPSTSTVRLAIGTDGMFDDLALLRVGASTGGATARADGLDVG